MPIAEYTLIDGTYWRSIRVGGPGRWIFLLSSLVAPLLQLVQDWHAYTDIFFCAAIPAVIYAFFGKSGQSRLPDYLAEAERDGRDVFADGDPRNES